MPPKGSKRIELSSVARCWTLRKLAKGEAVCGVWSHPLGRELRLDVNEDFLRSQVFRDLTWADVGAEWCQAFKGKGWTEPPAVEPVGSA